MASLAVVLIILGYVAYQYLKGTLVKAFAAVIITICASVVAFSYFEVLANVFISRSGNSSYLSLVPWAQPLAFVLLFVLAFAILQAIVTKLTRHPIDLGLWPERIGRVVCGIFLGLILSGLLLTALAMAPLPNKYPYQRFNQINPNAGKPKKVLFNADGFVTGWFSMISKGSFSGKRSFATLHPAFLDQVFLNRHKIADDISITTSSQAIEIPKKTAAWPAPEALKDSDGNPISQKIGHSLTIVRVGIKKSALTRQAKINGGTFTLSQLRVVCKQKADTENVRGKGKNIYPIGYLKTDVQIQKKRLNDKIELERADFDDRVRWLDFVFEVPNNFMPVLVEFKQNSIARVPPLVPTEQAPPAVPFIPASEREKEIAEPPPPSDADKDD